MREFFVGLFEAGLALAGTTLVLYVGSRLQRVAPTNPQMPKGTEPVRKGLRRVRRASAQDNYSWDMRQYLIRTRAVRWAVIPGTLMAVVGGIGYLLSR